MSTLALSAARRKPGFGALSYVTSTPVGAFEVAESATQQLTAKCYNADAVELSQVGRQVVWTTSNAATATVSTSGLVTGISEGICTITARIDGVAAASHTVTVTGTGGTAVKLAVTTQPAGAEDAIAFTTQPVVAVRDVNDDVVAAATNEVTAAISSGSGVLSGTTAVSAVNGVATFTNLVITGEGSHVLAFTATGLTGASSTTFDVAGEGDDSNPGDTDTILYDDNFAGYDTVAARNTHAASLAASEYFAYQRSSPEGGLDSIVSDTGVDGSDRFWRISVPATTSQYNCGIQIGRGSGISGSNPFAPSATTDLFVDLWLRHNVSTIQWYKGLFLSHSFDRTQIGPWLSSSSLTPWNVHPQSNGKYIWGHQEDGAGDAPVLYKRWTHINNNEWIKYTIQYKASTGTGSQTDGIVRLWINGEKHIDGSSAGLAAGWMEDRQSGVSSSSASPYPGNVGSKYSSVTGSDALDSLADDAVLSILFPSILAANSAAGNIDIGRIRVWYRPA